MLGKAADLLRGMRRSLSDLASAAGRSLRPLGREISSAWHRISLPNRRRIAVAGSAIIVILIVRGLIVPALPCSFPGGDECEPAREEALALVPQDAVAYVHADLDTSSEQYAKAVEIASRTPKLTQQIAGIVLSQFVGAAGKPSDFSAQIRPWFGGELLIAQLAPADGAGQVQMLQIADSQGAADYAKEIATANPRSSVYRGVSVTVDARGLASAIVDDFLVIGREAGVRSVIDVATGADGADPITSDETESRVRDELPDDAAVEAYVAGAGIPGLFGKDGPLAPAGDLVNARASKGVGVAVVAGDDGLELSTRSVLDPDRADKAPGPFAGLPGFDANLTDRVQDDALAYLGFGDPGETLQGLLKGAGRRAGGLLGGFSGVLRGLGKAGDIDLSGELLPALGDEAAFALIPRTGAPAVTGDALPGEPDATQTLPPDSGAAPYIELLADVSDEEAATQALEKLQPALAKELGSKAKFKDTRIGGVVAPALRVSATAQVAYAVFDSLFVFATDPAGVREIADSESDGLSSSELFQRASDGLGDGRSLLAYFDVGGLLRFAEANGQAANPAYATFADDLRRLQALAVSVDASDDELGTDSRLLVGGNASAGTGTD